jgi:hypothetical protein
MTLVSTPLFPLLVLVPGLPVLVLAFRTFDKLLCLQRTSYPDAWIADGRPRPFFFRGGLAWPHTFGTQIASRWLSIAWLLQTPNWVERDFQARHLLRRLRALAALWNLVVMPLFVVALIIAARADQQAHSELLRRSTTPSIPSAR